MEIEHAASQAVGERDAGVAGEPQTRGAVELAMMSVAQRPQPKTHCRRIRGRAAAGFDAWVLGRIALAQPHGSELELHAEQRAEWQLRSARARDTPAELILLVAADRVGRRGF